MPKTTQVKSGSTEVRDLLKITHHRCVKMEWSGNLPKIKQIRSGSKERSGNVPKTTELLNGSTERSCNLSKITQLICGSRERLETPKQTEVGNAYVEEQRG